MAKKVTAARRPNRNHNGKRRFAIRAVFLNG